MKRGMDERPYSINNPVLVCLFVIICSLACFPLQAQDKAGQREDIWFSPSFDMAMYSPFGVSSGVGIAIGYGSGTSIGLKAAWLFNVDGQVNFMELNALFRVYLSEGQTNSGLFIQIAGGPAIFFGKDENVSFPAILGIPSFGVTAGWRFIMGKYFFLEPSIRAGYPYIAGISLSAGVRF